MDITKKLQILSDAAKYDVSCSSSGSKRKNTKNGIGNAASNGICHTFTSDGRCVSLLKILMTNCCIYDCSYCINKKTSNVNRAVFTPDEICDLVINSSYYITDVESLMSSFISLSDDKLYENLWSEYFKSVNIPERKNTRAQKRMMPTRYWKNLIETQNL